MRCIICHHPADTITSAGVVIDLRTEWMGRETISVCRECCLRAASTTLSTQHEMNEDDAECPLSDLHDSCNCDCDMCIKCVR